MKKFILLGFATLALVGCKENTPAAGEEKPAPVVEDTHVTDAKHYYDKPEEMKPVLNECFEKVFSTTTSTELDALYDDKECTAVALAMYAIELGDWKKAVISEPRSEGEYSNSWQYKLHEEKILRQNNEKAAEEKAAEEKAALEK